MLWTNEELIVEHNRVEKLMDKLEDDMRDVEITHEQLREDFNNMLDHFLFLTEERINLYNSEIIRLCNTNCINFEPIKS